MKRTTYSMIATVLAAMLLASGAGCEVRDEYLTRHDPRTVKETARYRLWKRTSLVLDAEPMTEARRVVEPQAADGAALPWYLARNDAPRSTVVGYRGPVSEVSVTHVRDRQGGFSHHAGHPGFGNRYSRTTRSTRVRSLVY